MKIGIYVHVPFCTRKCDYCAFHSLERWSRSDQQQIVRKISKDARLLRRGDGVVSLGLEPQHYTARTIYIGGGTPSTLSAEDLLFLVASLRWAFGDADEVTCEANPESAVRPWLEAAADAGVSRLSLGVQTLDTSSARRIGRRVTTREELERIRALWGGDLSADVIVGIPGEATAEVLGTLAFLAALPVEHLSVYDLSVEPGTKLSERVSAAELRDAEPAWEEICAAIGAFGFQRYEVSNFARPGHESEHNLGYWRAEPYLGLGPSAVSTLPTTNGALRLTQSLDHGRYLQSHPLLDAEHEVLTSADLVAEMVMLGLRTKRGLSRRVFSDRFGVDIETAFGRTIGPLADDGLVILTDSHLSPTDRGLDLHNLVVERLLAGHDGVASERCPSGLNLDIG